MASPTTAVDTSPTIPTNSPPTATPSSASTKSNDSRSLSPYDNPRSPYDTRPSINFAPDPEPCEALESLSVVRTPEVNQAIDEPKWPSGWRPYTALFGGFLLMFNSWGLVNAYGTFASVYMQDLLPNQDMLFMNLVGGTQCFIILAPSVIVGRLLDADHSSALIITGSVLVTLGMFMLSVSNGGGGYNEGNVGLIWLTQGFVTALGMACFFVTSSQVVATWFKKKKGFAIGIVASGASISGLVYPMMINFIAPKLGFNNAVRCVAGVVGFTALMAIFLARPNPTHHFRKPKRWLALREWIDTSAFRNASYMWFVAAISFLFFGFYPIFFNLEEWAVTNNIGYRARNLPGPGEPAKIRTTYLLAIMNASSTVGRLSSSYLCDKFGALNVHAAVTTVCALLTLILWPLTKHLATAIAFVLIFGIFSGSVIGLPPACVAAILGPDPKEQGKLGQWTGMMYSTAACFALTGPVIAGHLVSQYDTYLTVQLWSGVNLLLSASCMIMAMLYAPQSQKKMQRLREQKEWLREKVRRFSTTSKLRKTSTVTTSASARNVF